jgi:serine/threonine protein kinase
MAAANNDSDVRIVDFGLASVLEGDNLLRDQCGTPSYIAPEILRGIPYGKSVDMWSFGVILYVLLCGYLPFRSNMIYHLYYIIMEGSFDFPLNEWRHISSTAKDLVCKLLNVDPTKRFTVDQALGHEWLTQEGTKLPTRNLAATVKQLIQLELDEQKPDVGDLQVAIAKASTSKKKNDNPFRKRSDKKKEDPILPTVKEEDSIDSTSVSTTVAFTRNRVLEGDIKPVTDSIAASKSKAATGSYIKLPPLFDARYTITDEIISENPFGVVKVGITKQSKKEVAIAVYYYNRPNIEAGIQLIENEVEIISKLNHPNIVEYFGYFQEKETFYVVTEKIVGGTLAERYYRNTRNQCENFVLGMAKTIFSAVKYLHDNDVVHR